MNKDFHNSIAPQIANLAKSILSKEDISKANRLSTLLLGSKENREKAIKTLQESIGYTPKRPVYYLYFEIEGLPEHTRHVVRNAGDYIDQMIKYCSYDKGDFKIMRFRGLRKSLGENLTKLHKVLPMGLHDLLTEFNEIIYVPSKHEWDVEEDKPHLFSSKEAVFTCLMAKELATKIKPFSQMAQEYDANKMHDYHHDSTQKYDPRR